MVKDLCPHFKDLQRRVAVLREKFISYEISCELENPTSFQSDLDRLAAFRLLVHAEFEEFLENKAKQGLDILEERFKSGVQDMRSNVFIFVIGDHLGKSGVALPQLSDKWNDYFLEIINAARKSISKNNGIKESSFRSLSIFSGKMPDEIDATLALSLNRFGSGRGDVAHKSASRVRTFLAPSAEASAVEELLRGLDEFFN